MLNRIFLVRSIVLGISLLIVTPILAQVSGNTGAYSTSIPIQVPSHRGLEPSVSLVYNSLGGNGIVGVGWGLTGFPVIERQGADGGTPQFNGTDSFRWGGEDLHPCGASSSPGCLAGGTHFTEHESYQRIIKGASDWTVD
ncbi:MAG: SpvB/TcaC N-terminal domain-containing protein, partial [Vicinamibacteria bacterium]